MCNATCSCTEPKCGRVKFTAGPNIVGIGEDGKPHAVKQKPLIEQIGALTRTAQQFEHKANSLRLLARQLQERVNRGER